MTAWLSIVGHRRRWPCLLSRPRRARSSPPRRYWSAVCAISRWCATGGAERLTWETPLSRTLDALETRRGRASWYWRAAIRCGSGSASCWLRRFPRDEIAILAASSARSIWRRAARLAAGRDRGGHAAWPPARSAGAASRAGRAAAGPERGRRDAGDRRCAPLVPRGFGPSRDHGARAYGRPDRAHVTRRPPSNGDAPPCADLNMIAVECVAEAGAAILTPRARPARRRLRA